MSAIYRRRPDPDDDRVARALRDTLISPNVADSNLEPSNVVDVLAEVATALRVQWSVQAYGLLLAHGTPEDGERAIAALRDLLS